MRQPAPPPEGGTAHIVTKDARKLEAWLQDHGAEPQERRPTRVIGYPNAQPRRGRAGRLATNTRTRGSRRTASAQPSGSSDDPGPSSEPPLRRHPRWGRCTPSLIRLLEAVR